MKLQGSYTIAAPRESVWEAIMDPEVLVKALPGAQDLEQIDENVYKAQMKIRVGPVQGLFNGKVSLDDVRHLEGYHLAVDGRGAPGFVKGEGDLTLRDEGEATVLDYSGDVQVGGRLASVGQRLMESSAQAMIRQSLESLETQVQARAAGEPTAATSSPSELAFAAGVTRKMLEEMVPEERRDEVVGAALAALLMFVLGWLLADR
ncbi:MAG: carbon monoxide dehydrogenase subunit G, partial [Candidatus Promineifilaceae bacterium]|nr:carbon monoxide dehydrogenase subunit G [Candidatus Promineifilaceae bacterium]